MLRLLEQRVANLQVRHPSDKIVIYASGMSRIGDLTAGTCTWGGLRSRGIGVEVGELSENGIDELAQAVVALKVQAFIDSGAYNLFRRKLKSEAEGAGKVKPLDFGKVLDKYEAIQATIAYYNEPPLEWPEPTTAQEFWNQHEYERMGFGCEEDVPSPLFVMPDVVGDQAASLALVRQYRDYITCEARWGIGTPIVPIQKGGLTFMEAYEEVLDVLGTRNFVVGVPSVESAMSLDELRQFLEEAARIGLHGLHFLGSASPKTLDPKLDVLHETGIELAHLSADANILRGSLYGQKKANGPGAPETRREAIGDKLFERAPELQAYGPHPSQSRAASRFRRALYKEGVADFEGRTFQVRERRLKGGGKAWTYMVTCDGRAVIRGGIWPNNWTMCEAVRAASREAFPWDDSRSLADVNAENAERDAAEEARKSPKEREIEAAEMAAQIEEWGAMVSDAIRERRYGRRPIRLAMGAEAVASDSPKAKAPRQAPTHTSLTSQAAAEPHARSTALQPRPVTFTQGDVLVPETAEVVAAFLRTTELPEQDVASLIRQVRSTLAGIALEASAVGAERHRYAAAA